MFKLHAMAVLEITVSHLTLSKIPKLFSVFTSHVIKTKSPSHAINKFKNLGYDS